MKPERQNPLTLIAASLIEPLLVPAAFIKPDGRLIHANAAWSAVIPEEGLVAAGIRDWLAPEGQLGLDEFLASSHSGQSCTLALSKYGSKLRLFRCNGHAPLGAGVIAVMEIDHDPPELADPRHWWQYVDDENQGFWDIDFETGKRHFSAGWSQLRGLDPSSKSAGDHADWMERLHPADRAGVEARRDALFNNQTDRVFDEYRERHADGHWIWILSRGSAVGRKPDGTPRRIIGIDTNISNLKFGIDREEELNGRLALVADLCNIGVWQYSFRNDEVQWDQRMRSLYGLSDNKSRMPASVWENFLHPDDRDRIVGHIETATKLGNDFDVRFRIVRKDGEIRHIRSAATDVIDSRGERVLFGINLDVTQEALQADRISTAYALIKKRNAALVSAHNLLRHRTLHDALTGLANRRSLDAFQADLLAHPDKRSQKCAVLQIDLDRFKAINDTLGHGAGDHVLKRIADILRDAAPPDSIVARVGGDEFAVVIANAPHDAMIGHWANEIIRRAEKPLTYEGQGCRFSVSIGIATGSPLDDSVDNLFSRADLALYEAKRAGRGMARFFTSRLSEDARRKRQFSDDILAALEARQFICHYQPQYDAARMTISGLEALVRWNHPTRGLLSPGDFLELCQELNVLARIDARVLDVALADARDWQASGRVVPRIFVNTSGPRLRDPALADRIAHLAHSPVPIGFELLETALLDDKDPQLESNLAALRALGVTIDIDDFGSGHASILGLWNLRPDRIKIDARLIRDAPEDKMQRALVQSIVEIGRTLRADIVAEGVETVAHQTLLREIGCDYLQGYGLCRPVTAAEIRDLLPLADVQPLRVLQE